MQRRSPTARIAADWLTANRRELPANSHRSVVKDRLFIRLYTIRVGGSFQEGSAKSFELSAVSRKAEGGMTADHADLADGDVEAFSRGGSAS